MATPKRLFLIDGSALAYRSFFAFQRQGLTANNQPTGAVFGFTLGLKRILETESPDYMAVVFDRKEPTFRHDRYPEYKATRDKMDDDLVIQLPRIRQVIDGYNVACLDLAGYEADDIVGTLSKRHASKDLEVYLVTNDKDFAQLVNDHVFLLGQKKGEAGYDKFDARKVEEKWGIPPERFIDYLALMGDASDNIPGIPGVGEKTALQLLSQFKDFDDVLAHPDRISKKGLRAKVEKGSDSARLSRDLVTIHVDAPIDVSLSDLQVCDPDHGTLQDLFQELDFASLLKAIPGKSIQNEKHRYVAVTTRKEFTRFLTELQKKARSGFAFDVETTGRDPHQAELVGMSFSWKAGTGYYIPIRYPERNEESVTLEEIIRETKPVLEDPNYPVFAQNAKYDMTVMRHYDVAVQGLAFDPMLAAYVLEPGVRRYGLDALSRKHFQYEKIPTSTLIGTGKRQIGMAEVPLMSITDYACEDADFTYRLSVLLRDLLKKEGQSELFETIEFPMELVLLEMEIEGVALDTKVLAAMSKKLDKQLDNIVQDIYTEAGEEFNINSTKQLGGILFDKLELHKLLNKKRPKRTKTGYATDVDVLESYAGVHALPEKLLAYRQLTKLKNTYVDALPVLINPRTGRLHTSFNQTIAVTGRLSSTNPNLQNIPIRTEQGREIRKAFVPGKKNYTLLSADYSQIELRLMAHLSEDETMIKAFHEGADIHNQTAALVFGVPETDIDPEMRRRAKAINFGIIYGMGPYGLARQLDITPMEADDFIKAYFATYPQIGAYIDRQIETAKETGVVETLFGRRRAIPEINSDNQAVARTARNIAINTPIQGTAADLIKMAMIRIHRQIQEGSLKSRMILQIHDELVFEAYQPELTDFAAMVQKEMEGVIPLRVPVHVEIGTGLHWLAALEK